MPMEWQSEDFDQTVLLFHGDTCNYIMAVVVEFCPNMVRKKWTGAGH